MLTAGGAGEMLYLDTSAFLKLYFLEEDSQAVNDRVMSQSEPLPLWDFQEAEFYNALRLKVFWGDHTEEEVNHLLQHFQRRKRKGVYFVPQIDRLDLMETFRDLSRHTPELGCRTLDIFHVACALVIGAETFMSFDQRQKQLAERAGLSVL